MKKKFFAIFGVAAMVGGLLLGTGAFNEAKAERIGSQNKTQSTCGIAGDGVCDGAGSAVIVLKRLLFKDNIYLI